MYTSERVQSEAADVYPPSYPRAFVNLDGKKNKKLVSTIPTQNMNAMNELC